MNPPERTAPHPATAFLRWIAATAVILLSAWLLRGFLPALAWAVVIALATWPLYQRVPEGPLLVRGTIRRALLFTLGVGGLLLGPLFYALVIAGSEAEWLASQLAIAQRQGLPPPDWLARLPVVGGEALAFWQSVLGSAGGVSSWIHQWHPQSVVNWGEIVGAQLLHRGATLAFSLVTLFCLYRDGAALGARLLRLSTLALGDAGERYTLHALAAVRAAVNGLVLVAAGEGVLIWMGYALAGLPSSAVWGLATAVLALVPFAAPAGVAAAGLILLAQGKAVAAVAVAAWGMSVLFIADHFVRPGLIGGSVRLPFLWVLLGILGGVETFGLLGLFLGPVVMALAVSLWREIPDPP